MTELQYKQELPHDRQEAFEMLYTQRLLGEYETISGRRSTLMDTRNLRHALAGLIEAGMFKTILDIGCGDFNWMSAMDLSQVDYVGVDISLSCIDDMRKKYARENISFEMRDIVTAKPPPFDFVLCKDVFCYLGHHEIVAAFNHIKDSGSRYIGITDYQVPLVRKKLRDFYEKLLNCEAYPGYFNPINMRASPYFFPMPLLTIEENFPGKMLDIWKLDDLPHLSLEAVQENVKNPLVHNPATPEEFSNYRFFQDLCLLPFVRSISLFGSRADDTHRPDSDIDLMLFCRSDMTREQWLEVCAIIDRADIPLEIDCKFFSDTLGTFLNKPPLEEQPLTYKTLFQRNF